MQTAFLHQQRQNIILLGAANNIFYIPQMRETSRACIAEWSRYTTQNKNLMLLMKTKFPATSFDARNSIKKIPFRAQNFSCRVRVMEI